MLILSRKQGEAIVLPGYGVEVTVMHVSGDRVKLGIQAPAEIPVHRQEVFDKIASIENPDKPTVGMDL